MAQKKSIMVITVLMLCAVCLGVVFALGFGGRTGRVFTLEKFDGPAVSAIQDALRVHLTSNALPVHASMVGGKDWMLFAHIAMPEEERPAFLTSLKFQTRKIRSEEALLESPALSWWKIDHVIVEAIQRDTASYTDVILCRPLDGMCQIFMYTDGGPSGFPSAIWAVFQKR